LQLETVARAFLARAQYERLCTGWFTIGAMFKALRAPSGALVLLLACSRAPTPTASPSASDSTSATSSSAPSATPSNSAAAALGDAGDLLEVEADREWEAGKREDIIYVPTPQKVVDKMLEVAHVTSSDVVYDLGCGDGRIVVTAAKIGATAIGFDLDPVRVSEARANVTAGGVGALASIRRADVFSVDLQPATVVTLYLLPHLNVQLIPQLEKLRAGSRIVSHDFGMKGVIPDGHWTIMAPEFVTTDGYSAYKGAAVPEDKKNYKERAHDIYLWTIPLKKAPPRDAGQTK
jgi:SAM-dependent methyltransferase